MNPKTLYLPLFVAVFTPVRELMRRKRQKAAKKSQQNDGDHRTWLNGA
jgi:hypothetical protein